MLALAVGLFALCQAAMAAMTLDENMYECYMFSNDRMIYRQGLDYGFEASSCYMAIPVYGVPASAKIVPVFTPGSLAGVTDLKVWTDKQMVDYYLADWNNGKGESWWDDFEDSDGTLWYETSRCSYEIEEGIWDGDEMSSRNVTPRSDRRWILFKWKNPKSEWGGMKTFTLGIKGTDVTRKYAAFSTVNGTLGMRPTDFFNRVTVTGYDTGYDFELDSDSYGAMPEVSSEYAGCDIWMGNKADEVPLRVRIPESGTLVLRSDNYIELSETGNATLAYESDIYPVDGYEAVTKFGGTSRVSEMRWRFGAKTTLEATGETAWEGFSFTQMLFFPSHAKSVAIVSLQADYDETYNRPVIRGYVKGSGTFKAGETVKLTAVSGGALFKGWEVVYGELPQGVDLTKQVLSFVVPESMCGTEAEMKQVTVRAVWIDKADDRAAISVSVADEYAPKVAIDPIAVDVSGCTSLPSVKVKGLPPGLKFTAKALDVKATKAAPAAHYAANTVYGTPTKSGVHVATFTVTTAGKHTASTNVTFTVLDRSVGESFLKVACDAAMGKATGAGIYAVGKKVTLKATPLKGHVFAGWYDESGSQLAGDVDYRTPSFPYLATGVDTTVRAEFVPAEEDTALELLVDEVYNTSGEFDLPLVINSVSLPKVSISGLPSGIKFDAKSLRIAGTATKPGTYTVTAKLTNATVKKAITQKFDIVVDNLTGANGYLKVTDAAGGTTPLLNGRGEKYVMSVGVQEFDLPVLNAANVGDKVTLSGLPAGLKYSAKTGRIEGVATKAGTFTVQVTVKSGKASYVSTFTVEVQALPSWAVGTFAGVGIVNLSGYYTVEDNLYGTVTIGTTGKVSGKFLFDTDEGNLLAATLSAKALTGWECDPEGGGYFLDVTLAFKDGRNVVASRDCRFRIGQNNYDDGIGGGKISLEDADITLYQNVWKVKGFENLPVFAEKKTVVSATEAWKDGGVNCTATLTLTIDPNGGVSVVLVEEGVYGGETLFRDRYARKDDLIVTHHWTERAYDGTGIDCYKAEIPFFCATVEMRTSADGKIHASGCKVVD